MSILWISILDLEFTPGGRNQLSAWAIARAIEKAIRNKSLPLGAPLPTTRQLTAHLSPAVGRAAVDMAWSILKNELQLIVTSSGHGTHVVSAFPETEKVAEVVLKPMFNRRSAYFNKEFILPTDKRMRGLDNAICKEIKLYPIMDEHNMRKTINPQLVDRLLMVINHSLYAAYKEDELYYAQSHPQLIHHICRVQLSPRKIFVMADTASFLVRDAVTGAGYNVKVVKTDSSGMMMESLEEIVSMRNVGIVYVRSRSVMPRRQTLSLESVGRLLELQVKYKFIIIEDDQYAAFYEKKPHILMQKACTDKANVIYIRPVSRAHQEFVDLHIVVAQAKLISRLSELFQKVGKIASTRLLWTVTELLRKNILHKYEARVRRKMGITIMKARNLLLDSGLWKLEGLFCENGWLFYLELTRGHLSVDIIDLLQKEHIYVMDIADFDSSYVRNSIVLSTAAYLDGDHLEDDIHRLNEVVHKVINNRKNESII